MATEIKRNSKGLYQLRSSITDELLHDQKWITEDEAKSILITNRFYEYMESVIKIDGDFPVGSCIDGVIIGGVRKGSDFIYDCYNDDENCDKRISEKFDSLKKKYKLP